MRIGFDATPAAAQRAGVGRYARELLRALVATSVDDEFILSCAATPAETRELLDRLPPGAWREIRRLPAAERYMTAAWQRARFPVPIETFIGGFDVFHATDFVAPPARRPVVVTVHDLSFVHVPEFGDPGLVSFLQRSVPRSLKRASAVICVSASVASEVAEAYPWVRHRLMAIPNGVSIPAPGRDYSVPDVATVLIVGTIEPRKNHLALFDAMDEVRRIVPEARLVVAGRVGWRSAPIVERLRVLVAAGLATFIDSPNDAQLEAAYASASMCAFPSFYEGFGLPVLEAMARGVPVVAGDIPALRETGGDAARYAAPDDPMALAAAICAVLTDRDKAHRLSELGMRRSHEFSWAETAARTRRAYAFALEH